jgi:hypothetical protein
MTAAQATQNIDTIITFSEGFTLTAGVKYWIVIQRTGALNDSNYYNIYYQNAANAGRELWQYNGSAWVQEGTNYCLSFLFEGGGTYHGARPSGVLVHSNAVASLTPASINANAEEVYKINFLGSFTLTKGQRYWIVIEKE